MQFSISTIFTLLVGANIVHAGVVDKLMGRQITEGCQYIEENYLSRCMAGDGGTLFCTGNKDTSCKPYGKTDGFDAHATQANEDVCKGVRETGSCMQTIQCC